MRDVKTLRDAVLGLGGLALVGALAWLLVSGTYLLSTQVGFAGALALLLCLGYVLSKR